MATNSRVVLDPDQLNDADEAILDALHEGRASPSYLSDRTGIEQTYINQRLRRLDEHGHVDNLARGLWELADDPRRDDTDDEGDLRARLQDALEARDDAQARADRLADELEDCRERLDAAESETEADVEQARDAPASVSDFLTTIRLDEALALELRDSMGRTVIAAGTDDGGEVRYAVWEHSALSGRQVTAWEYRRDVATTLEDRRPRIRLREQTPLADVDAPSEFSRRGNGTVYRGP